MFGSMSVKDYISNYDCLISNKPLKYGNMKGKLLDKDHFLKDYSDYEILLRDKIPEKYFKYFKNLTSDSDHESDIEIEIGRSNKSFNLSPIKSKENHNDIKDSEVLFGKDKDTYLKNNESKFKNNDKVVEFNLNIDGNRGINDLNDINELFEQTYKILNNNDIVDKEGKQLNIMIEHLINNMKKIKSDNSKLNDELADSKKIIKDLSKLIDSYKLKLKHYWNENHNLKSKSDENSKNKKRNEIKEVDEIDDNDFNGIPEIREIDLKILELKEEKEKLIKKKKIELIESEKIKLDEIKLQLNDDVNHKTQNVFNINLPTDLSDNIAQKILNGLDKLKQKDEISNKIESEQSINYQASITKKNPLAHEHPPKSPSPSSHAYSHTQSIPSSQSSEQNPHSHSHSRSHSRPQSHSHYDGYKADCPFCGTNPVLSSHSSKLSSLEKDKIIEAIADLLKNKLNAGNEEIW